MQALIRLACVSLAIFLTACAAEHPATPGTVSPVRVTVAGPVLSAAAPGRALYLVRYDIAPGTRLPAHRHEGTQIGRVEAGTLTYHVLAGRVPVYRVGVDGKPVLIREISKGEQAELSAGEWLVEAEEVRHWGANLGSAPLVIHASALLREGAPLATPVPP
jgi:quercetin dioxygenase-like cupin family protein